MRWRLNLCWEYQLPPFYQRDARYPQRLHPQNPRFIKESREKCNKLIHSFSSSLPAKFNTIMPILAISISHIMPSLPRITIIYTYNTSFIDMTERIQLSSNIQVLSFNSPNRFGISQRSPSIKSDSPQIIALGAGRR